MKKKGLIEEQVLSTFKKEIPSQYFSHLDKTNKFYDHENKVTNLYRFGLMFPPEFFLGKKVIDLGSGTGDNTISLARWGALITLVEINPDALEISKNVFSKYTKNFHKHKFINSSLYDIDLNSLRETFDISHSRGVFMHVEDKLKAFKILAALTKPGGYIIYGDRNTYGGLQEMLQRYAIYYLLNKSAKKIVDTDEKIVDIAEILFSADIDRSQKSIPRTRRAIIFDRWVIQQQNDPTINEVLSFFKKEGLEYVNSWPRIDFAGRGTSTYSDLKNLPALRKGAKLIENIWMILNKGELENIEYFDFLKNSEKFSKTLETFVQSLRNVKIKNNLSKNTLFDKIRILNSEIKKTGKSKLREKLNIFFYEIKEFLKILEEIKNPDQIRKRIDNFQILFKGYAGVRHVDYIAYKPKHEKKK